jgi:hypothetical protein
VSNQKGQIMKTQNDAERIEILRALLGTVVHNTKQEMNGKIGKGNEAKHTANVLTVILGRTPTKGELELAQRY